MKVDYQDDGGWIFGRVESIDVERNAVEVDFEDGEMVWVEPWFTPDGKLPDDVRLSTLEAFASSNKKFGGTEVS